MYNCQMVHLQKLAPPPAVKEVQPRRQDTFRDWAQFLAVDICTLGIGSQDTPNNIIVTFKEWDHGTHTK